MTNDGSRRRLEAQKTSRIIRWTVALAISAYLGFGFVRSEWKSCQDVVLSSDAVQTLCKTEGAISGPSIAAVLTIIVLFAPDVSEAAIPGLLSIKRRLKDAEMRSEQQEARQLALEMRLLSISNHTEVNTYVGEDLVTTTQLNDALDSLGGKLSELGVNPPSTQEIQKQTAGTESDSQMESTDASLSEIATLGHELILHWEDINTFLNGANSDTFSSSGNLLHLAAIQVFRHRFENELHLVRTGRNAFVHGKKLSQSELTSLVKLARTLNEVISRSDFDVITSGIRLRED